MVNLRKARRMSFAIDQPILRDGTDVRHHNERRSSRSPPIRCSTHPTHCLYAEASASLASRGCLAMTMQIGVRLAAALFPVLQRRERDAVGLGKLVLRHPQSRRMARTSGTSTT